MKINAIIISVFIAGSAVLLLVGNGSAKDDCSDAKTVGDLHKCASKAFLSADREMTRVYRKLYAAAEKNGGKALADKLAASQQAWITFRDKECDFAASTEESVYPIMFDGCLISVTEERTKKLKSHMLRYQ